MVSQLTSPQAHLQRHKKLWMENPRNEEASVLIDGIYVYCSPGRVQTKDLTLGKYARAAIKARKETSSNRQLESSRCKPFEAWLTGICLEALCRHKKYYKLSLLPYFKSQPRTTTKHDSGIKRAGQRIYR